MEKEQVHQHHGRKRDHEREADLANRLAHEDGEVDRQTDFDALRQAPVDLWQRRVHGLRHGELVGCGLSHDSHADHVFRRVARHHLVALRAQLQLGHVIDADRHALLLADHDAAESLGIVNAGVRVDDVFAGVGLDLAGGQLEIALLDGSPHIEGIDVVSRHACGVEPDTHRIAALAADHGPRDTGQELQRRLHVSVRDIREIHRRIPVAGHVDPYDRPAVGSGLADHRTLGRLGQTTDGTLDGVGDVHGGDVDVAVGAELDIDRGDAEGARGVDAANPLDAVQRLLERLGDGGLDGLGASAQVDGRDRHQGSVHIRVLAHGERGEGRCAGHHDEQAHYAGQHRSSDGEIGEDHVESQSEAPKRPS